jgi:hypothetical protein
MFFCEQVHSQRVQACAVHAPGIFKIREDKFANQPAKKRATHYRIHVLPLLNRRGWKQLVIYTYIYIYIYICMQDILHSVIERMM